MDKALVVNGTHYASALANLDLKWTGNTSEFFNSPEDFSLILFTGGEDVSPELYGDASPKNICSYSPHRDEFESKVYQVALKYEIKMTGICRGIQFLNVMNGGRMMHHLENHAGSIHEMQVANGDIILVNSLHHQMCLPGPGAIVIGWASQRLSDVYIGKNDEVVSYDGPEIEALIYSKTGCAGVQYHPEMLRENSEGAGWYEEFVYDLLSMDMDKFIKKYTTEEKLHGRHMGQV